MLAQVGPTWLKLAPSWLQDGPKLAHVGSKLAPRWPIFQGVAKACQGVQVSPTLALAPRRPPKGSQGLPKDFHIAFPKIAKGIVLLTHLKERRGLDRTGWVGSSIGMEFLVEFLFDNRVVGLHWQFNTG